MTDHTPSEAPEAGSQSDASSLAVALRRAQAAVAADFLARFEGEAIRPIQFALLRQLRLEPGMRQNRASDALGIKRTNFVPLFDALARRGLVERRPLPDDRRAAALFLTTAGEETLARLEGLARAHEARFAARVGESGRAQLLGLLARLADPAFDPG